VRRGCIFEACPELKDARYRLMVNAFIRTELIQEALWRGIKKKGLLSGHVSTVPKLQELVVRPDL
jgi:hypothetical protein